jgi:hypothetical protein
MHSLLYRKRVSDVTSYKKFEIEIKCMRGKEQEKTSGTDGIGYCGSAYSELSSWCPVQPSCLRMSGATVQNACFS